MTKPAWLDDLFTAIDGKDGERFVSHLCDDGDFRFGNAEPVHGREAIRDAVVGFFSAIDALSHELQDVWVCPDAVICRGRVTYTRMDGSRLTVPFANVFKMRGEKIADYAIYIDTSQLFGSG